MYKHFLIRQDIYLNYSNFNILHTTIYEKVENSFRIFYLFYGIRHFFFTNPKSFIVFKIKRQQFVKKVLIFSNSKKRFLYSSKIPKSIFY